MLYHSPPGPHSPALSHASVDLITQSPSEDAALTVLIDTVVADQAAKGEGLDPTASEATAYLQSMLSSSGSLSGVLSGAGINPNSYVTPETVSLYRLAAGRAALEGEVTSGLPASERAAAWSNYVTGLVNSATIVKYGGL